MNCDVCDDLSGDFRIGNFMRSVLGCLKFVEGLFQVMADILMSRELMFFI